MVYNFIIHTNSDEPGSLKRPVKIAFTLTPANSKRPTCPYSPVARGVTHFPADWEQSNVFEWDLEFSFVLCEVTGKTYTFFPGLSCDAIPPGQSVKLSMPLGVLATWSDPEPYNDHVAYRQFSIMGTNETGSDQSIGLRILSPGDSEHQTSAVYNVRNCDTIIAPTELILQVYVVSLDVENDTILLPEDLSQPLLTTPIKCDTLPTVSVWKLSQDNNGTIRLQNDDDQADWEGHSVDSKLEILMKSIADVKKQLTDVERSVNFAHNGLESGQREVAEIRTKLEEVTRLPQQPTSPRTPLGPREGSSSGLNDQVAELQTKTDQLTNAYGQSQEYLTSVQQFLQATRQQIISLDRKVPAVEARLGTSLMTLKDRVATVEGKTERLSEELGQLRDSVGGRESLGFPTRPFGPGLPRTPPPFSPESIGSPLPVLPSPGLY